MSRSIILAALSALGALLVATGGQAAGRAEPWSCPSSKVITVWFWPDGHGETPVGGETSVPHVELFTGPSARASLGSYIASMAVAADQFGEGVIGGLCAPVTPLGSLRPSALTTRSGTTALTCRFPRIPLIVADRSAATHGRLRIVLPPNRVAVTIDMKMNASQLRFAPSHCTREGLPGPPR